MKLVTCTVDARIRFYSRIHKLLLLLGDEVTSQTEVQYSVVHDGSLV